MKTIYILLIAIIATACNSDDPVDPASLLPPITMTGENTFGCLIDGKFFRPRDGGSTINSDNRGLILRSSGGNSIEIDAHDYKSSKVSSILIRITDIDIHRVGIYVTDESNGLRGIDGLDNSYIHCRIWNNEVGRYQTYLSYENSGLLHVSRLERSPGIYYYHSGTFETKLINSQNQNDTIKVTLGRFDIDTVKLIQTNFN
jgi:hypothetical protein